MELARHLLESWRCEHKITLGDSKNTSMGREKFGNSDIKGKVVGEPGDSFCEEKFRYEGIMRPSKLRKGVTRWNQCEGIINGVDSHLLQGKVLDFGSGVGYFVYEGLRRGIDMWGVDILPGKMKRYRSLLGFSDSPKEWRSRCLQADGTSLPFGAGTFSAVISWFVFEHIPNTGEVLRELVRITRPGGVIIIRAQDSRCEYEGHCKIPWVPYLPDYLAEAWAEEFGKSISLRDGVYDITQPQVISILEALGCCIVQKDESLPLPHPRNMECHNEKDVRKLARQMKNLVENGEYIPRQVGLYLCAQKK